MDYEQQICQAMDVLADGEEEKAQSLFNECISEIKLKVKQGDVTAQEYYYWGMCLNLMDEPEQALLKFEQAIRLNPEYEEALWQVTSILFYTQQSAELALSILENKLLKIRPEHPEYRETLADIQSYMKHLPKDSAPSASKEKSS